MTQAGYRALDRLQVVRQTRHSDVSSAMKTNAWKGAKVLDIGGEYGNFEFRWDIPTVSL
ncbi:hypothetical protein M408DRAFT_333595, partial [Serendipita vermifera MAFF 305830]